MNMNFFLPMDPSSAYLSINWISTMFLFLMVSPPFIKKSRMSLLLFIMNNFMKKEIFSIIKSINIPNFVLPFSSIFFLLLTLNFMSLLPYIFTPTSHMTLNFPISFVFWLSLILYAWFYNYSSMYIHLTPQNTPFPLIPFMVLIELISQMIRPLTLSIRLTTNMIAGHLLLILLTSMLPSLSFFPVLFSLVPLLMLIILEIAVAFIQAYVFSILLALYAKEIN